MSSNESESSTKPLPEFKDIEPCISIVCVIFIFILLLATLLTTAFIQAGLASIALAILVLACQVYKLDHKSE